MIFKDKTALITGASSGIGEAFARRLAAQGSHLILAARSQDRLEALARDLRATHHVNVTVIAIDLARQEATSEIAAFLQANSLTVDLLVNNAGFGTSGPFVNADPAREREEVLVNVLAVVDLCHLVAPGMVDRGSGAIVNVASNAAFQPMPYMAVYAASKSFVLSFSQALHEELRDQGVRVLGLCPGPTETAFFEVADAPHLKTAAGRLVRTPDDVVTTALKALEKNRSFVVDGFLFSAMAKVERVIPPTLLAKGIGRSFKPTHHDRN